MKPIYVFEQDCFEMLDGNELLDVEFVRRYGDGDFEVDENDTDSAAAIVVEVDDEHCTIIVGFNSEGESWKFFQPKEKEFVLLPV